MLSLAVVIGVALLVGFRPTAGPVEWIAAIGVLAMISLALTWLSVALGLVSKSVETASNLPMPLILLPFLGSGFVPTDSMPAGLRWFAEYQPFTPVIETLRGPAARHPDRQQRDPRRRLVRRDRAARLPVGASAYSTATRCGNRAPPAGPGRTTPERASPADHLALACAGGARVLAPGCSRGASPGMRSLTRGAAGRAGRRREPRAPATGRAAPRRQAPVPPTRPPGRRADRPA